MRIGVFLTLISVILSYLIFLTNIPQTTNVRMALNYKPESFLRDPMIMKEINRELALVKPAIDKAKVYGHGCDGQKTIDWMRSAIDKARKEGPDSIVRIIRREMKDHTKEEFECLSLLITSFSHKEVRHQAPAMVSLTSYILGKIDKNGRFSGENNDSNTSNQVKKDTE